MPPCRVETPPTCRVCGGRGGFRMPPGYNVREAWCPDCGAKRRTSDLVSVLLAAAAPEGAACLTAALGALEGARILEAQAAGVLHAALAGIPGYVGSEFLDDVPAGTIGPGGVRCEDLERLTFPDGSFDLVISQDVLEHVADPWQAFREIERVLAPGGHHVFTVPMHEGRETVARARREGGRTLNLLPPVHHGDPLREAGSLVYADFGDDLAELLRARSIDARPVVCGREYAAREIPWIDGADAHRGYLRAGASGALLDYFRYNSIVILSRKAGGGPGNVGP